MNLGKILANQNLARQSWFFIQETSKILGNIFSREEVRFFKRFFSKHKNKDLSRGLSIT